MNNLVHNKIYRSRRTALYLQQQSIGQVIYGCQDAKHKHLQRSPVKLNKNSIQAKYDSIKTGAGTIPLFYFFLKKIKKERKRKRNQQQQQQ